MDDLTEHARKNRVYWDAQSDDYETQHSAQLEREPRSWGVWSIPESELNVLGDVRDARCVGLDNSARQLAHARRLMAEAGIDFPLVHASAEAYFILGHARKHSSASSPTYKRPRQ